MELSEGKVRYSPSERLAFRAVPKNGKAISTIEVAEAIYGKNKEEQEPWNKRQIAFGVMVSLGKKMRANREPFRLERTKRRGPHPILFTLRK